MAGGRIARMDVLHRLPATFTYSEARRGGLSDRQLYRLRDDGVIEAIGRGLFRRTDVGILADVDLLEIARLLRAAAICARARPALTAAPSL